MASSTPLRLSRTLPLPTGGFRWRRPKSDRALSASWSTTRWLRPACCRASPGRRRCRCWCVRGRCECFNTKVRRIESEAHNQTSSPSNRGLQRCHHLQQRLRCVVRVSARWAVLWWLTGNLPQSAFASIVLSPPSLVVLCSLEAQHWFKFTNKNNHPPPPTNKRTHRSI